MSARVMLREPACSFCGEPALTRAHLVVGPLVGICDVCVDLAAKIVREMRAKAAPAKRKRTKMRGAK